MSRSFQKNGKPIKVHERVEDYFITPIVVEDIQSWVLFENKKQEDIYLIGNKELDRYFTVPESQIEIVLEVLSYFDGNHSIKWIEDHYYKEKRKKVDILSLYHLVAKSGLIAEPEPAEIDRGELEQLSIKIASFDIKKIFESWSHIAMQVMRWGMIVSFVIIAIGMVFLSRAPEVVFASRNFQLPGISGFLLLYAAILSCVLLHELAHAITATRYGVLPTKFEINLYLGFLLVFFLKMAGLYTLKPKQRLVVWGAGIFVNLTLGCLFIIIAQLFRLSLFYEQFLARIAFINFFMAAFSLLPLLPTDGYFIMSTLFKKANLRTRTWTEFKNWVSFKEHQLKGNVLVYFVSTISVIIWLLSVHFYWIIRSVSEGKPFDLRLYYPFFIIGMILMRKALVCMKSKFSSSKGSGRTEPGGVPEEEVIT